MRSKTLSIGLTLMLAMFTATLFVNGSASAQETVLHAFNNSDGDEPIAGVIFDASGNIYGTTFYGGANGVGEVFELTPQGSGWTETVLHSFNNTGVDGFYANSSLVFDGSGNLYGTTYWGGDFNVGTVFELSPAAGGGWTEKVVHSFDNHGGDGTYPHGGLIVDGSGNIYGTAAAGGASEHGIVYELTPTGGDWTETILYSFTGTDGAQPEASLTFDGSGNLFGTTEFGGSSSACTGGCGTVFELSPTTGGGWTETVLLSFNTADGANPGAAVVFDKAGNLYGTAGGASGNGPVFELAHIAGGGWREKIVHRFSPEDGNNPSTLLLDAAGNLYGPTATGGAHNRGTIFELRYTTGGQWGEKILYSFGPKGGYNPAPGLVLDGAGNLYGAALSGANSSCLGGCGTVFKITP